MKTSELIGPALDWAVAKCEGLDVLILPENRSDYTHIEFRSEDIGWDFRVYTPSTDWSQGGPIIEREELALETRTHKTERWIASSDGWYTLYLGSTSMIAAMRCYVASKLGDEVELPPELLS